MVLFITTTGGGGGGHLLVSVMRVMHFLGPIFRSRFFTFLSTSGLMFRFCPFYRRPQFFSFVRSGTNKMRFLIRSRVERIQLSCPL